MVMIPDNPQRGVQLSDSNTQEADCHHRRVAVDYHVHPRGRRDVHERTFVCHSWNKCQLTNTMIVNQIILYHRRGKKSIVFKWSDDQTDSSFLSLI